MGHSKMFDTIKYYFDNDYWAVDRVHEAVVKRKITPIEFKEITGTDYE